jgi:hypothetical protein
MLPTLLRLTGLDVKLAQLKRDVQQRADAAIAQAKSLVLRLAVSAGLIFAAVVLFVFAIVVGFIAHNVWADAPWGPNPAVALVGGVVLLLAVLVLLGALWTARGGASDEKDKDEARGAAAHAAAEAEAAAREARPQSLSASASGYSSDNVDAQPFLYLLGRYAGVPKSGYGIIDDLLGRLGPRAETAANDIIGRASTLVREGDRKTMLAILAAAAAVGWLAVKASDRANAPDSERSH